MKEEINGTCDLNGMNCPFPLIRILREAMQMAAGETKSFLVDDPLAVKAIPEELEDYADIRIAITEQGASWKIIITRI
jgi:TusA-related sulfurtransferase